MSRKVRVTQNPDREFEVGEAEYLDLKRQGLLVQEPAEEKTRRASAPSADKEEK